MTAIQQRLAALQDADYRAFHSRLMPTIDPETILGVRTPAVRTLAKKLEGRPQTAGFLCALPHRYYEENNLHAFLIERIPDYAACLAAVEAFLPYVDNWATCDSMRPRAFRRHRGELLTPIARWLGSDRPFTVRFGIEMLMTQYLDDAFDPSLLAQVAAVTLPDYYVRMMVAWYFATALAKQYDATVPYIEQHRLERWTHNKAIQKAIESYRITPEQKAYLRTLKE